MALVLLDLRGDGSARIGAPTYAVHARTTPTARSRRPTRSPTRNCSIHDAGYATTHTCWSLAGDRDHDACRTGRPSCCSATAFAQRIAGRRPLRHELRRGDSSLRPVSDEDPPPSETRQVEDPDEHALRAWRFGEQYRRPLS